MRPEDTIYFEYRASVLDEKCIDDEILANELLKSFKANLINGVDDNFNKIPFSFKVNSTINDEAKIENNYTMEVIFMNPDAYEEMLDKIDRLQFLLARNLMKNKKSEIDDWISNKKVQ